MSDSPKKPFNKKANIDFTFDDDVKKPEEPVEDNDTFEITFTRDEPEVPQDVLYEIASKAMPDTPEVQKAMEYVSNLDYLCLLTAISVQEELRGKIPDAKLDLLTAAALAMGADNIDDIYDLFEPETMSIVDEFISMLTQDEREERLRDINEFSKDAKRLFFCSIIADLQVTAALVDTSLELAPPKKDLEGLGTIISRISFGDDIDQQLVTRATTCFNKVTEKAGYKLELTLNDDGTAELVKQPPSAKPKPPQP